MIEKVKTYLVNFRPYSIVDLILIGFLAKTLLMGKLVFELSDLYFMIILVLLWAFFNFMLEAKHAYSYRGKVSISIPLICLILVAIIGLFVNPYTLIFIALSTFFVLVYIQKARNRFFGNTNFIVRGLIQLSYFLFSIAFFSKSFMQDFIYLTPIGLAIFFNYCSRAMIADIRDFESNKKANKRTFVVDFGKEAGFALSITFLILSSILTFYMTSSWLIILPLVFMIIALLFYRNGYVLHQLMINVTSFYSINYIAYISNYDIVLLNLVFVGIFLNFLFYPLMKRKSNPKFVQ